MYYTQDLVVSFNVASASTTLTMRILPSPSVVHGKKSKKFNRLNFKRCQNH